MMANEMRDRLVELLLNGEKQFFDTKANRTTPLQSYLSNYLIENGVVVPQWISVDDRLPEEKERVLVFLKNNTHTKGYTRIDTDRLIKGNWIRWGGCVTHWMPLPEPPKSEYKLKEMRGGNG